MHLEPSSDASLGLSDVDLCTRARHLVNWCDIKNRLEEDDSLEDRTPFSLERVAELLQLCLRPTYSVSMGNFTSKGRVQRWDLQSQQ